MQKKTLLCTLLAASALFTACKKNDDNNTDQLSQLGKATVSGKVTANLVDTAGATLSQIVPTSTVITAWIDTRDLIVNPSPASYAKRYYTANVDASGNYKLTVDVSKYKSATVYIDPQPFNYDQVRNTIGIVHHDSIYTVNQTFYSVADTNVVSVHADYNAIQNLSYHN